MVGTDCARDRAARVAKPVHRMKVLQKTTDFHLSSESEKSIDFLSGPALPIPPVDIN
jgi:hypothetical protein